MQTKECVNYIIDWLLNYSKQSKTRGFVVGVSGGIDSAVTSTLAAKTGLTRYLLYVLTWEKTTTVLNKLLVKITKGIAIKWH